VFRSGDGKLGKPQWGVVGKTRKATKTSPGPIRNLKKPGPKKGIWKRQCVGKGVSHRSGKARVSEGTAGGHKRKRHKGGQTEGKGLTGGKEQCTQKLRERGAGGGVC